MKFTPLFWTALALTSLTLTGCNPLSDDDSGNGGGNSDTINDPNWNTGVDELVAITIPQFDNGSAIFALTRNNIPAQNFLSGERGDRRFSSTRLAASSDLHDITSFRITQSENGSTKTDYLIAACSTYRGDAYVEFFLVSDKNNTHAAQISGLDDCVSIAAAPVDSTDGSNVQAYISGMDGSTAKVGKVTFNVDIFATGSDFVSSIQRPVEDIVSPNVTMRAVEAFADSNADLYPIYAVQSTTNDIVLQTDSTTADDLYSNTINPLTGLSENADLTDLLLIPGKGLFMVGEDQGLAAIAHSTADDFDSSNGEAKKISGDGSRCIDALAWDGSQLWCHDATSEGRLIRFNPPQIQP